MVIHKRTRLTPLQRQEIYRGYPGEGKHRSASWLMPIMFAVPRFKRLSGVAGSGIFRYTKARTSDSAVYGTASSVYRRSGMPSRPV